jgi:iron complex outermembrane recepter protein
MRGQSTQGLDTLQALTEVAVQGYLSRQPLLQTPASVGILNTAQLRSHAQGTLLPALNLLPGVRMEERSPGSYRLSLRGSLLRSPFGVRNVKVYLNDFPLTDAGGNTYLNLLDPTAIERVEVLRGPDGSLFGANSGGVVLLDLNGRQADSSRAELGLRAGAFGLLHQHASAQIVGKKSRFAFNQAFQQADGYRQHTALKRQFWQLSERLHYGKNNNLQLLAFFTDLHYQTPGGLTQAQYDADPRQARPAAGPNPGAVAQQAGIFNKTLFAGLSNELWISTKLRYVAAVFAAHTDFKNPFISTYETRKENNLGVRTFAELQGAAAGRIHWKWNLGLEAQQGRQDIETFQNSGGTPGVQLAQDALKINQLFYFSRLTASFGSRFFAETALSLNTYQYFYAGWAAKGNRQLAAQWMPRFAMSYQAAPGFSLRATFSRGYSPPGLAEVRASDNRINNALEAESGWNRELGFRLRLWRNRLQVDASVFRYELRQAIVRQLDDNGAEYFVNAGGTRQTGLEAMLHAWLLRPRARGFLRGVQLNGSFTYSDFIFKEYRLAGNDYSGNRLTGVPRTVLTWSADFSFAQHITLFVASNATAAIPLNDGNSATAAPYHLLQAKLNWSGLHLKRTGLSVFLCADNLLNQKYSLGNDLNAFGGRYYNAAAPLNFSVGVRVLREVNAHCPDTIDTPILR